MRTLVADHYFDGVALFWGQTVVCRHLGFDLVVEPETSYSLWPFSSLPDCARLLNARNQFAPYAQCPRCADEPPVIEWNLGPAGGGEGTAGRDLWQDGETLIVAMRTNNKYEYAVAYVCADEDAVCFNDDYGNDLGIDPDSVYWWAKVD